MSGEDKPCSSDVEEDRRALDDCDVPDEAEVAGRWICEHDRVLALDDEAGYVERSELDPGVLVGKIVSCPSEMIQAGGNVHDLVAIDKDLELADSIIKVV